MHMLLCLYPKKTKCRFGKRICSRIQDIFTFRGLQKGGTVRDALFCFLKNCRKLSVSEQSEQINGCTRPGVHGAQQDSKRSPKRGPKGRPGGRACARGFARIFNFCSTYLLILNIWIEATAHFLCTPKKYRLFSWFYVEKPDMRIRAILFFSGLQIVDPL